MFRIDGQEIGVGAFQLDGCDPVILPRVRCCRTRSETADGHWNNGRGQPQRRPSRVKQSVRRDLVHLIKSHGKGCTLGITDAEYRRDTVRQSRFCVKGAGGQVWVEAHTLCGTTSGRPYRYPVARIGNGSLWSCTRYESLVSNPTVL
jgi:hypothetical protein